MKIIARFIVLFGLFTGILFGAPTTQQSSYRFVILHQIGARDNIYFTFEGSEFTDFNASINDQSALLKMNTPEALKALFPEYDQEPCRLPNAKIIHLIKHSLLRPYLLDRKVTLDFQGILFNPIEKMDGGEGKLKLSGAVSRTTMSGDNDELVYIPELSRTFASQTGQSTIRDELSGFIKPSPAWRILWISTDDGKVISIKCPGTVRELKWMSHPF